MAEKTAERIAKWDHVKLFLIVCVVTGHMLNSYLDTSNTARILSYYMYLFHMPAFILISGIFSKRTIQNRRYDKIFGYLVLYFFILFLKFAFIFYSKGQTSLKIFTEGGTAWYAFVMFCYYLMTIFLKQFDKRYVMTMAVVLGCLAGYDTNIGDFLALSRIVAFYPFFLFGYYMEPGRVLNFVRKKQVKIISILILAVTAYLVYRHIDQIFWTMDFLKGRYSYKILDEYETYGALIRLIHYILAIALSFSIISVLPARKCFLSFMGGRTLSVYALHMFFVYLFYQSFKGGALAEKIWPEHYIILIIIISLLMVLVLSLKPFHNFVNFVCFPKKTKQEE